MTTRSLSNEHERPRSPSPTITYHPSLFPANLPTPALLESVAGGAHYSGVKIERDTRKVRRNSSGIRTSHLQIKGDHEQVLDDMKELYSCRPTREILERRWRPDARFEDPFCQCTGFDEYAAQWFAMPKWFSKSVTVSTRVLSSTKSPNRLVYAQTQDYTMRLFGRQKTVKSIITIDLDEDEKIIRLVDQWDGKELPTRFGASFLRKMNAKLVPWLVHVPKTHAHAA